MGIAQRHVWPIVQAQELKADVVTQTVTSQPRGVLFCALSHQTHPPVSHHTSEIVVGHLLCAGPELYTEDPDEVPGCPIGGHMWPRILEWAGAAEELTFKFAPF